MKEFMILFLVGRDRPGIVDDVTTVLFDRGANIEDSRMAALGGSFSIMILLSFSAENRIKIEQGLVALREMGFDASLHEASDPAAAPRTGGMPLKLAVVAMDHPGIVRNVVRRLRKHDANIESLTTTVHVAPLSGHPLFDLELEATVPPDKTIAKVKEELVELAFAENLDLKFS
jgi:glycine cleavage system transcriptional repressor